MSTVHSKDYRELEAKAETETAKVTQFFDTMQQYPFCGLDMAALLVNTLRRHSTQIKQLKFAHVMMMMMIKTLIN
jgi:hypothetical protein